LSIIVRTVLKERRMRLVKYSYILVVARRKRKTHAFYTENSKSRCDLLEVVSIYGMITL
jgi:hypothetical protein